SSCLRGSRGRRGTPRCPLSFTCFDRYSPGRRTGLAGRQSIRGRTRTAASKGVHPMKVRLTLAVLVAALTSIGLASTATAQPHQNGLVNVAVVDNTVQIPIGVAANVCGVAVNILASATATAPVNCTAVSGAEARSISTGGGSGGRQGGIRDLALAAQHTH